MNDRDREVMRGIGYGGATSEQIGELVGGAYDIGQLIAGGFVRRRRIELVETGPPMPEPAYFVLTARGAIEVGLDPDLLDSLG